MQGRCAEMYVSVDTYTYTHALQHWVALVTDYLDVYVHKLWTYACSYLHPCCFQRRSRVICFVFGRLGMPTHSSMSAAVFKIERERVSARKCVLACMHACAGACVCACGHACMHPYIYIYACIHTCMYVCMHACMHAYIHMYTHTYIHT